MHVNTVSQTDYPGILGVKIWDTMMGAQQCLSQSHLLKPKVQKRHLHPEEFCRTKWSTSFVLLANIPPQVLQAKIFSLV